MIRRFLKKFLNGVTEPHALVEYEPADPEPAPTYKYKITILPIAGHGRFITNQKGEQIEHPIVRSRGRVFFMYATTSKEAYERFAREGIVARDGLPAVPPSILARSYYERLEGK